MPKPLVVISRCDLLLGPWELLVLSFGCFFVRCLFTHDIINCFACTFLPFPLYNTIHHVPCTHHVSYLLVGYCVEVVLFCWTLGGSVGIFFSAGCWMRYLDFFNGAGSASEQCLPSIGVGCFKRCWIHLFFVLHGSFSFFYLLSLLFCLMKEWCRYLHCSRVEDNGVNFFYCWVLHFLVCFGRLFL